MNFSRNFFDSLAFTRTTLMGKLSRWLTFILLLVPWLILSLVLDGTKINEGATIHWDRIPWGFVIPLTAAGIITSVFVSGYIVRLLRAGGSPPGFDDWRTLASDGIRMDIVVILWALPFLAVATSIGLSFAMLPLLGITGMAVLCIVVIYGLSGIIRFSRTGSIAEGYAFPGIGETIHRIGWGNYFAGLLILLVIVAAFTFASWLLSGIPVVGMIIPITLKPLIVIFCCRFLKNIYDSGLYEKIP